MYSYFARYKALAGYQYDTDVYRDFYGRPKAALNLIGCEPLPEHFRRDAPDWLPSDEIILSQHTLIPVYAAFHIGARGLDDQTPGRRSFADFGSQRIGRINRERRALGMAYCPSCVEQDYKELGESYWRRLHNLYGVFVCPRHEVHLERLPSGLATKSQALLLPPEPGRLPRRRRIKREDRSERFLLLLASDLSLLLEEPDLRTARQRVAFALNAAVVAAGLDYKGIPSVRKTNERLLQRCTLAALRAFHFKAPPSANTSWCQAITGWNLNLDPVAVAVAMRVVDSSLGQALGNSTDARSSAAQDNKGEHRAHRAGPQRTLQIDKCWPVDCPEAVANWLPHTFGTTHERARSRFISTEHGELCPDKLMAAVKQAIAHLLTQPRGLCLSALAGALGTKTAGLRRLMGLFPKVAEVIISSVESEKDFAIRKIRQAVARWFANGGTPTPVEIMHASNTHKWYRELKPFIEVEISRQAIAHQAP